MGTPGNMFWLNIHKLTIIIKKIRDYTNITTMVYYLVWQNYFQNYFHEISIWDNLVWCKSTQLLKSSIVKLSHYDDDPLIWIFNIYAEWWMHWKDNQALIFSFCLCFINKINLVEDNRNKYLPSTMTAT